MIICRQFKVPCRTLLYNIRQFELPMLDYNSPCYYQQSARVNRHLIQMLKFAISTVIHLFVKLSAKANKAATWEDEIDHLNFTYNGKELVIPETYPSLWVSAQNDLKVERTSSKNSVLVNLTKVAEISINVVPVTKEDDRIHNYQIPSDDCFAHLEVQFKFFGLSPKVEGVHGRTYQPDFKKPAKPGVAMPVVGDENKYRTTLLLSANCGSCVFSPIGVHSKDESRAMDVVQNVELFAGNE
ncbi:hypothetical protein RHMOL_Rhmol06G0284100 [Rhododendron molle]|uniref:Uncharacterized protein n=1 Tax=Rhododendron molle TaxID=49168 RepID=A0ACC0NIP9_RHOML|nr:hypothetical protein RHMOL_Rhmol06G0284100 [Rhododendron molle]